MKDRRILSYVNKHLWALTDDKVDAIRQLLSDHAAGHRATTEELAAFAGPPSPPLRQQGAVAVLPLRGVIAHRAGMLDESSGGVSTETFAKTYTRVMQDPAVAAVVLDVDSVGGAVAGVHELAQQMLALRGTKKVIAVANSVMASGAYWLAAAAADEIWAIPSATIGAIGVASIYIDDSKARELAGITLEVFTSAENKIDVLGLEPLSADAKARRQARVDEAGAWFRSDIAKGRGVSVADVRRKFGEGSAFGAKEALSVGLIDRIGTLDEAIARLVGRKAAGAGVRAQLVATFPGATVPEADRCPSCQGAGLKPERFMSDPQGQEECPDCHGTGKKPEADAAWSRPHVFTPDGNGHCLCHRVYLDAIHLAAEGEPSELERGKLDPEPEPVDLADLVGRLL